MEQINPWAQVVSLLSDLASHVESAGPGTWRGPCRGPRARRAGKGGDSYKARLAGGQRGKITVIERPDDALALISWCDPTMCHYVDQVWTRVTARSGGYCALTEQRIHKGDSIFKPRTRGQYRPVNGDAMILAAALC